LGTAGGLGGISRGGRGFAIDSYNVHRLVIAGVTVASKFFSDVFYTNSRYAKVGGLPPHELNQLELQFLLLNDFRLVIPPEEMQRYGDRLLGYWEGREAEEPKPGALETSSSGQGQARPQAQTQAHGVAVPSEGEVKAAAAVARGNDAMDVDPPQRQSQPSTTTDPDPVPPSGTTTTSQPIPNPVEQQSAQAPPPSTSVPPPTTQPVAPRGRERDPRPTISTSRTGSFDNNGTAPASALTAGLRDWVRGEEVMGVMGNRMTSPMRD